MKPRRVLAAFFVAAALLERRIVGANLPLAEVKTSCAAQVLERDR